MIPRGIRSNGTAGGTFDGDTGFYAIVDTGWHDIGASSTAYHVAS